MNYWTGLTARRLTRRQAFTSTATAALGAAFLAACGGGSDKPAQEASSILTTPKDSTSQAKPGGSFKWFLNAEPRSFEPGITEVTGFPHVARTYQGLIMQKPVARTEGRGSPDILQPYAAQSWEYSADKLTLTFKLQPNMKWDERAPTSGRAVTAQDVVFSWKRFSEVSTRRAELANTVSPQAPVISVTASDASTVVFKLAFPYADLISALRLWSGAGVLLVPPEMDGGFDYRKESRGSGPWLLEEFVPSSRVVWKRNPLFYDQSMAMPARIEAPILSEYASALAQLKAGNLHTYNVRPEDLLQTKQDAPDLQMVPLPVNGANNFLFFGYQEGSQFRDKRVRQAFMYSLDRDAFIDTFYNVEKFRAAGLPIETAWNTSINCNLAPWWLDPKGNDFGPNAKYFKRNLTEAKALLSAAGHGSGLKVEAPVLTTPQYGADYYPMLEVIFGMAQEAGFSTTVVPQNFSTEWRPRVIDAKGNFKGVSAGGAGPLSRAFFSQMFDSELGPIFKGFDPDGRGNAAGDPKMNDLARKLMQEFDIKKAASYAHDIQRYDAEMVYAPFFPGGANSFALSWPALGNFGVFDGDTILTKYWIDETKRPVKA